MSTKIYNAFRMKADSLDEVIQKFFKEKETIKEDIEYALIKDVLLECIVLYDKISLEGESLPFPQNNNEKNKLDYSKSVMSIVSDKFWNRTRNKDDEDLSDNQKELEVNMIIYPQPINHFGEKSYLMQLFGKDDLTSIVENKHLNKWGVEEYNYWNNTDPPDTLTDYEWNLRRQNWKDIDIPLFSGVSLTFVKSSKYEVFFMYNRKSKIHHVEKVLEELNQYMTIEKRVSQYINKIKENVAYKYCYDVAIKKNNLENADKEKVIDFMYNKGMSIYFESKDRVKEDQFTDEEKLLFTEKEKLIRKILKNHFLLEDFSKKGEDILKDSQLKTMKKIKP